MCKLQEESFPKFCKMVDECLKKNGDKYCVGDCVSIKNGKTCRLMSRDGISLQLTYADLSVACLVDFMCKQFPHLKKCVDECPCLTKHCCMVCDLPKIKEHIAFSMVIIFVFKSRVGKPVKSFIDM